MTERLRLTIAYDEPDEEGWIVARVIEVPGAISEGRTRTDARENVIDALRLMLSPDENESRVTSSRTGRRGSISAKARTKSPTTRPAS
jgi:predicted RNase H-like HicB family nuclease